MRRIDEIPDYARMDYERKQHHERYLKYVINNEMLCQECGGAGRYFVEEVDGFSRCEWCGWCEGTGKVTRWIRGAWLRCKREEKVN